MYDFDSVVNRKGSNCVKWDTLERKYKRDGLMPYWIADMDFEIAPCIAEAVKERAEHRIYGYSFPGREYKQAICSWFRERHSIAIQPDWILPGVNTVTSFTIALGAVTKAGDKCLVFTPVYDPLSEAVGFTGRELVTFPMKESKTHYELDFVRLEEELSKDIRCLIFCNPHNPGGKVWTESELAKLAFLCKKYQVVILSDDVHCDWVFEPLKYIPLTAFADAAERTVLFTAPSKTFNLAGIGNCNLIIEGNELREKVQRALMGMFIRGSNTFAYAAVEAAYSKGAPWVDEVKKYVWENTVYARNYLQIHMPRLRFFDQQSTFMIWIDCREVKTDGKKICQSLVHEYGIVVNDGAVYGEGGDGFIRINAACPRTLLETAMETLEKWYDHTIAETEREGK